MKRLAIVALSVGLGACTASHATQTNAPVNLFIVDVNGAAPLFSDIGEAGVVTANLVDVSVVVRAKNPAVVVPQIALAVQMKRYEVVYRRSDGRNVPGVDVPFAISGPLAGALDAATSGEALTLSVEVVRIQQKLEPPLRNLRGPQADTLGGTAIAMSVIAEITVYGETLVGQVVSDSAQLQIDFADFG